jgi:hypothetical protein
MAMVAIASPASWRENRLTAEVDFPALNGRRALIEARGDVVPRCQHHCPRHLVIDVVEIPE